MDIINNSNGHELWELLCQTKVDEAAILASINLKPELCFVRQNNELPIHFVVKKLAYPKIVETMLSINPQSCGERDSTNRYLVHHVITGLNRMDYDSKIVLSIIENYPLAVCVEDPSGNLSLHHELKHLHRPDILAKLIEIYPQACRFPDNLGEYPLHRALHLINQFSLSLISAFVDAYPDAAKIPSMLKGDYMLHYECQYRCRYDVVAKLLQAFPNGAKIHSRKKHRLPLHMVLREKIKESSSNENLRIVSTLLDCYPDSVNEGDYSGYLPLHYEISTNFRVDVIQLLLIRSPKTCVETSDYSPSPLHTLLSGKQINIQLETPEQSENDEDQDNQSEASDDFNYTDAPGTADNVLEVVMFMLDQYPHAAKVAVNKTLPIHLECKHQCRLNVLMKLIELYPESCITADNHGSFPLHIVLSSYNDCPEVASYILNAYPIAARGSLINFVPTTNQMYDSVVAYLPIHSECENQCRYEIIKQLLEVFPESAGVKANQQSYLLHLALQNKRCSLKTLFMIMNANLAAVKYHDKSLPIHLECAQACRFEVISKLLEYYPQSVHVKSSMYADELPIHLAARNRKCHVKVMSLLLKKYPESCQVANGHGCLPLNRAVEIADNSQCHSPPSRYHALDLLLNTYPEAIHFPIHQYKLSWLSSLKSDTPRVQRMKLNMCMLHLTELIHVNMYHDLNWKARKTLILLLQQLKIRYDVTKPEILTNGIKVAKVPVYFSPYSDHVKNSIGPLLFSMIGHIGSDTVDIDNWMLRSDVGSSLLHAIVLFL